MMKREGERKRKRKLYNMFVGGTAEGDELCRVKGKWVNSNLLSDFTVFTLCKKLYKL